MTSKPKFTPAIGPFYLWKPSDDDIGAIEKCIPKLPFSFPHVGLTRTTPPLPSDIKREGWVEMRTRRCVGSGLVAYNQAVSALKQWKHFDLGWAFVNKPPLKKDAAVVVTAQSLFLWSCNPLKVSFIEQGELRHQPLVQGKTQSGNKAKASSERRQGKSFTFGHTTVQGHQIDGEERFTVEWDKADDSVWYEIYSVSKPGNPLVWVMQPLLRFYQYKFAMDSVAAVQNELQRP